MSQPVLVLGSHNKKKVRELVELLEPLGIEVQSLDDYPDAIEVEETGETFQENARKKAIEQALHLGRWVLGEDSGISVDALDGRPGVYSARYSGPGATDESNNAKLLEELADLPLEERTAHYVCHTALADPDGNLRAESRGRCDGRIRFAPEGSGGFGYDPLFEHPDYGETFGTLPPEVKQRLSHRAAALEALVPQLKELLASGAWDS